MATLADRTLGLLILLIASTVFAYYTFWVIITPFIDVGHPLLAYFPSREYAITIPLVLILLVLFTITTFLALIMIKSRKPAKPKAS